MRFAALLFSNREWELPAAIFLVVAIALLVITYRRAPGQKLFRVGCVGLKLLGIAALLLCLLEPLWTSQRARPGANFFTVLADNSQGLHIKDRNATTTRGEVLTNLLASPNAPWLEQLEQDFQLRRYTFDSRLQSARDFAALDFSGRASALTTSLRQLTERYRGQPLAGILVFTDGNATDLIDGTFDSSGLPPIYPVVLGSADRISDLAIQKTSVSQTAFEDQPVTITVEILAAGYAGRMLTVQLLDPRGAVVQEQHQRARNELEQFRFQLRPEQPGVNFYQLRVAARDELEQFTKPELTTEATLANNTQVLLVDRGQGPYRILYVGGRPNWEFKFLNRALLEDRQVELVGLIRIAKREPKFEFRGRVGETSNPLFRGFDRTTETTEGYDQPVLVRLNTKDATELVGGFPTSADILYNYTAVIVDDLEAGFFTRDQMTLLQKFVSERGGGFLMLGGAESFQSGNYQHTPIGEMLPVYLDFARETKPAANLRLSLTREGWLQPWARLRDNEADERKRLTDLPPLHVHNAVRGVKPGASVVSEARDEAGQTHPALVAQRFGSGRVGALLLGDLWRWGLHDEVARKDLDKAWRQMIRWLIADVPAQIEFAVEPKPGDPNQYMSLQVRARNREYRPLENATVRITITAPTNSNADTNAISAIADRTVSLSAEPALNEAGRYDANYVPRATGGYLAEAVVTDAEGVEVGRAQTGWVADPAAAEFKSLQPNRALLETIARQTGGEIIAATDLKDFAEKLPNRSAPITESWSFPLWHQPLVFLFALACFAAEWGLRRWKGLA